MTHHNATGPTSDWTRSPARHAVAMALLVLTTGVAAPSLLARVGDAPREVMPLTRALDANTASAAALEVLPGIGPALAQRIVDFRTAHGPFLSLSAMDAVPGIGPRTLDDIAPYLRFSSPSPATGR